MSKKNNIKDYKAFFSELFIFRDLPEDKIREILNNIRVEIYEFEPNEDIYTPDEFESKVGFVMSGECSVEKQKSDGTSIPLNKLKKGDPFGILAVFLKNERFPTIVRSCKHSCVMFFSKDTIVSLIKEYPEVSLAIITFMSERIDFLNKKIATFSADSVEEKFVFYIIAEAKRLNSLSFQLNLSKTAKTLNAGRASIYRAIEDLEKLKLIKFENKKIYISDLKSLERITL